MRTWSYGRRGARRRPELPNLPLWLIPPLALGVTLGLVMAVFALLIRAVGRALVWFLP